MWSISDGLIALTLERRNLIGMKLFNATKLMGEGKIVERGKSDPDRIFEKRQYSVNCGCLGCNTFEIGYDKRHRLVGWNLTGMSTQNWIFENVVAFDPTKLQLSNLIPKAQRSTIRGCRFNDTTDNLYYLGLVRRW